VIEKAKTNIRY